MKHGHKPFKDIPCPRELPVLGTALSAARAGAFRGKIHQYFEQRYHQLGAIYREKLGDYSAVYLHDPRDVEYLLRNEGKYPRRTAFTSWLLHRQDGGLPLGLLLQLVLCIDLYMHVYIYIIM